MSMPIEDRVILRICDIATLKHAETYIRDATLCLNEIDFNDPRRELRLSLWREDVRLGSRRRIFWTLWRRTSPVRLYRLVLKHVRDFSIRYRDRSRLEAYSLGGLVFAPESGFRVLTYEGMEIRLEVDHLDATLIETDEVDSDRPVQCTYFSLRRRSSADRN